MKKNDTEASCYNLFFHGNVFFPAVPLTSHSFDFYDQANTDHLRGIWAWGIWAAGLSSKKQNPSCQNHIHRVPQKSLFRSSLLMIAYFVNLIHNIWKIIKFWENLYDIWRYETFHQTSLKNILGLSQSSSFESGRVLVLKIIRKQYIVKFSRTFCRREFPGSFCHEGFSQWMLLFLYILFSKTSEILSSKVCHFSRLKTLFLHIPIFL